MGPSYIKSLLVHVVGKLSVNQIFIENVYKILWVVWIQFFKISIGMSSIGDALLLDRNFIALRMSSSENKVNENEFSWVSYFSWIFITRTLFLKVISDTI